MRAQAADWTALYTPDVLSREKPRLQQIVQNTIAQEIEPYFTTPQRRAFSGLQPDLRLESTSASPIEFDLPRNGFAVMPVVTLLFVEDLAKAYAWLWANRCSSETVDEYAAMLRYRKAGDFPDNRYPPPLEALHIPANGLDNPETKKMFFRLRNTAYSFMLLHQLGLQREGNGPEQADQFALDLMKRNSETPMGLLLLMTASVHLPEDRNPATPARLQAMADYLDLRVLDFVQARPDRTLARNAINAVARSLRASAVFLQDQTAQNNWAERARRTDSSMLTPQRHGN